jgi:hypothetical protein
MKAKFGFIKNFNLYRKSVCLLIPLCFFYFTTCREQGDIPSAPGTITFLRNQYAMSMNRVKVLTEFKGNCKGYYSVSKNLDTHNREFFEDLIVMSKNSDLKIAELTKRGKEFISATDKIFDSLKPSGVYLTEDDLRSVRFKFDSVFEYKMQPTNLAFVIYQHYLQKAISANTILSHSVGVGPFRYWKKAVYPAVEFISNLNKDTLSIQFYLRGGIYLRGAEKIEFLGIKNKTGKDQALTVFQNSTTDTLAFLKIKTPPSGHYSACFKTSHLSESGSVYYIVNTNELIIE